MMRRPATQKRNHNLLFWGRFGAVFLLELYPEKES